IAVSVVPISNRSAISLALAPTLLVPTADLHAAGLAFEHYPSEQEVQQKTVLRLAHNQTTAQSETRDVAFRYGRHKAFDRFVFEALEPIKVDIQKSGDELIVTLDQAIETTLPPESALTYKKDQIPQLIFDVQQEDQGRRYRITLDPESSLLVHRWNNGRLIALDIMQAPLDDRDDHKVEVDSGNDLSDDEDGDDEYDDDDDEIENDFSTVGEFELFLSGSLQFGVATAGGDRLSDDGGDRGYGFFTDVDVNIDAITTFDDDVEVGASITLEAEADVSEDTANADEAYIFLENRFGQMQLGRTSGAEDDMALGADTVAAGTGGVDGDAANLGNVQLETSGDAAKISYFTPRISGFQAGVSYTPDTGDDENDNDAGFDFENYVGMGLNYVETHGEVEVSLAIVGSFADSEFSSADDLGAYGVGGTLEFEMLELGASYGRSASDLSFDYEFATLGATLGIGETSVGIGYNFVDEKSDGISHIFVLSGDTPILPGVDLQGDVSIADPEDESANVASVLAVELGF
ncbi:MAG: porin, partial [Pseudomonadota bacterium]